MRRLVSWPQGILMSKAFISKVLKESMELTAAGANRAADDLTSALTRIDPDLLF